jgi:hypothetical protein
MAILERMFFTRCRFLREKLPEPLALAELELWSIWTPHCERCSQTSLYRFVFWLRQLAAACFASFLDELSEIMSMNILKIRTLGDTNIIPQSHVGVSIRNSSQDGHDYNSRPQSMNPHLHHRRNAATDLASQGKQAKRGTVTRPCLSVINLRERQLHHLCQLYSQ